jgi:hypothetical protein
MKKVLILCILTLALAGCETGEIAVDPDYIPVDAVYEITAGVQEVIRSDGFTSTEDIAGYGFIVNQNELVVDALSCLGKLDAEGVVNCTGTTGHLLEYDGTYTYHTSGKLTFFGDDTMEAKIQINGSKDEGDFSYTVNYTLKGKVFVKEDPSG